MTDNLAVGDFVLRTMRPGQIGRVAGFGPHDRWVRVRFDDGRIRLLDRAGLSLMVKAPTEHECPYEAAAAIPRQWRSEIKANPPPTDWHSREMREAVLAILYVVELAIRRLPQKEVPRQ